MFEQSETCNTADIIEGVNLKLKSVPASRVTDYEKINEAGSGKANPENNYEPSILIRDMNMNTESYTQISSSDIHMERFAGADGFRF